MQGKKLNWIFIKLFRPADSAYFIIIWRISNFTYFELYEKVTADVHEAEVVDSKGCSSLIPDVPAPCSTTCEVKEEAVEQPQDQVQENEPELPTRPSRVSFTQGEKSEGESLFMSHLIEVVWFGCCWY